MFILFLFGYPTGTTMERTAMYNAVRGSTNARKFFFQPGESEEADLTFALEDLDRVPIGDNFTIVVTIKVRMYDI